LYFIDFIFLAVQAGSTNTYTLQGTANSGCVLSQNDSIVDFISSSPFFTNKSAIYQISNNTWGVNLKWSANVNQSGKYIQLTKILVTFFQS
jgi:hypothetical protein